MHDSLISGPTDSLAVVIFFHAWQNPWKRFSKICVNIVIFQKSHWTWPKLKTMGWGMFQFIWIHDAEVCAHDSNVRKMLCSNRRSCPDKSWRDNKQSDGCFFGLAVWTVQKRGTSIWYTKEMHTLLCCEYCTGFKTEKLANLIVRWILNILNVNPIGTWGRPELNRRPTGHYSSKLTSSVSQFSLVNLWSP